MSAHMSPGKVVVAGIAILSSILASCRGQQSGSGVLDESQSQSAETAENRRLTQEYQQITDNAGNLVGALAKMRIVIPDLQNGCRLNFRDMREVISLESEIYNEISSACRQYRSDGLCPQLKINVREITFQIGARGTVSLDSTSTAAINDTLNSTNLNETKLENNLRSAFNFSNTSTADRNNTQQSTLSDSGSTASEDSDLENGESSSTNGTSTTSATENSAANQSATNSGETSSTATNTNRGDSSSSNTSSINDSTQTRVTIGLEMEFKFASVTTSVASAPELTNRYSVLINQLLRACPGN